MPKSHQSDARKVLQILVRKRSKDADGPPGLIAEPPAEEPAERGKEPGVEDPGAEDLGAEEGAREDAGCDTPAAPSGGAIARVCSGCNRKGGGGARAPRASSDAAGYLHCLAWCAAMYLGGSCPDFGVSYSAHRAPTARQLASHLQEREAALGAPYKCRPSPHPPWP